MKFTFVVGVLDGQCASKWFGTASNNEIYEINANNYVDLLARASN